MDIRKWSELLTIDIIIVQSIRSAKKGAGDYKYFHATLNTLRASPDIKHSPRLRFRSLKPALRKHPARFAFHLMAIVRERSTLNLLPGTMGKKIRSDRLERRAKHQHGRFWHLIGSLNGGEKGEKLGTLIADIFP